MSRRVQVAFLWHLHQPDYRDPVGGDMALPWVRLHATRGYNDLAFTLEQHPGVRATVNLTASLLDQLEALVHGRCGDRYLQLSRRRAADLTLEDRHAILRGFFMIDWERGVRPLPRYWALLHKRGRDLKCTDLDRVASDFTDQDFRDLQVLFNLAWMGFAARATEDVVKNLLRKGEGFTELEKDVLFDCQERVVAGVLPRWRALAERGQIELATSPYYHPILPLLLDTDTARLAQPGASLPPRSCRVEDARLQVERALAAHGRRFGARPAGMWPPEGAVSQDTAALLAAAGLRWFAADEDILLRSDVEGAPPTREDLHRSWSVALEGGELPVLFRDRQLSDRVGFAYAHNPAPEAVADFLGRLADLGRPEADGPAPTVLVALDGENPWDHYPDSARDFLGALHAGLARGTHDDVRIDTVTCGEAAGSGPRRRIRRLHAGSWIESSFQVWIGDAETNLAWQLVSDAARMLDQRGPSLSRANYEEALDHLLAAEGSDWFWWFGDDFASETPEVFDALFRARVSKIYELVGEATAPRLRHPISEAALGVAGSTPLREPTGPVTPVIDGRGAPFMDWYGAGVYRPTQLVGNMYRSWLQVTSLHYGADMTELFLRLDVSEEVRGRARPGRVRIDLLPGDRRVALEVELERGCHPLKAADGREVGRVCFEDCVELALACEPLGLPQGERVLLAVHLVTEGVEIERLPRYGHVSLRIPDPSGTRGGPTA